MGCVIVQVCMSRKPESLEFILKLHKENVKIMYLLGNALVKLRLYEAHTYSHVYSLYCWKNRQRKFHILTLSPT